MRPTPQWDRRTALGVVLAAAGYPEGPRKGDAIEGLERITAEAHPDVIVFHAGTALADGTVVVSGGRVLCVTALADSVRQAQRAAYAAIADIAFRRHAVPQATSATARWPRASNAMDTAATRAYFLDLQARIVAGLEAVGGEAFRRDEWTRPEGGGGISRLIEDGGVLERGGVLFSHVTGASMPASATAHRPDLAGRSWEAMGVSLVLHPRNPFAPTVHLNVRCFTRAKAGCVDPSGGSAAAWT